MLDSIIQCPLFGRRVVFRAIAFSNRRLWARGSLFFQVFDILAVVFIVHGDMG